MASTGGIGDMMGGALDKFSGLANRHPRYLAIGAIALGALVMIAAISGMGLLGSFSLPLLILPGALLGLGFSVILIKLLEKHPKLARVVKIISSIVIPVLIGVVGFTLCMSGVTGNYFPYGMFVLAAIPLVLGAYTVPTLSEAMGRRRSVSHRRSPVVPRQRIYRQDNSNVHHNPYHQSPRIEEV